MRKLAPALCILVHSVGVCFAQDKPLPTGIWTPVPLISSEMRAAGVTLGGEGGQWVRTIAIDSIDGSFLIYGTDVGGMFRSLDGGNSWEPANVGFRARGTSGSAIDPHNPDRALVVAANSTLSDFHGLWLSTNRAASWTQVLPTQDSGSSDFRDQIAFDPSSYDRARSRTTDVYWSRVAIDKPMWGDAKPQPALYKSTDGGDTWTRLPDTAHLGGGIVRVHPTARGVVFIATPQGLFRSDDAASSFKQIFEGELLGLDVSRAAPDRVIINTKDRLLVSEDRGQSFTPIDATAISEPGFSLRGVRASPTDASRFVIWRQQDDGWDWRRYTSADAGKSWTQSTFDNSRAFLPYNVRNGVFAFHPTNNSTIISTGGDWPTRSDDGGKTYRWSGSGFNVFLVGGAFHFSLTNPDSIFLGSQDYNGAVTADAGHTWRYVNPSGQGWGGFTYAGHAATPELLYVGNSQGWGGTVSLRLSTDAGRSWINRDDVKFTSKENGDGPVPFGIYSSLADSSDPARILYFGPWRSIDAGKTWKQMTQCDGVVISARDDAGPFSLGLDIDHAAKQSRIVESRDAGATWKSLASLEGIAADAAIDRTRQRLYVVVNEHLRVVDLNTGTSTEVETPLDEWNGRRISSVTLDPVDPSIVYAAQHRNVFIAANGVLMSRDAGATWTTLNLTNPLTPGKVDGGREPFWLRVHPRTRDLWVATSCMGVWRINVVK